jgi:DNA-binding CsgD family transcriptional regulator
MTRRRSALTDLKCVHVRVRIIWQWKTQVGISMLDKMVSFENMYNCYNVFWHICGMKGRFSMLDQGIPKGGGDPMTAPNLFVETILKLHKVLARISELVDFPECITEPLQEVIPFERLFVFLSGHYDSSPTLITKHAKTLPWDSIYPGITTMDQHSSIIYRGKPGEIFLSQNMKGSGCEGDEHALGLIRIKSDMVYSIHLILSVTQGFRLFLSLFRMNDPFTSYAAETLGLFAPALIMYANALLAVRLSGSEELLLSNCKKKAHFYFFLLDNNREIISISESTRGFFAAHFHDPFIRGLPTPLREWLDSFETMNRGHDQEGERHIIFKQSTGNVDCTFYAFNDSSEPYRALVVVHLIKELDDFTSLRNIGLTSQEVIVLGSLYAGKTNSQIGESLGIKNITVRKHLLNIGRKLQASGRTEILSKAIEVRDMTPSEQCTTRTSLAESFRTQKPRYFSWSNT